MRKPWPIFMMEVAKLVAEQSTCQRRQVGAVISDDNNRILATGFNGVPPGWGHCRDNEKSDCPAKDAPSGTLLDGCYSNHAEINALLNCSEKRFATTMHVTTSPCVGCIKALLCTSIQVVCFLEEYPQPESRLLWTRGCRTWAKLENGQVMIFDVDKWVKV